MGYWIFPTRSAADVALAQLSVDLGQAWDEAVRLRDGRWAFSAVPDIEIPDGATLMDGVSAMLAGVPKRGEPA